MHIPVLPPPQMPNSEYDTDQRQEDLMIICMSFCFLVVLVTVGQNSCTLADVMVITGVDCLGL